MIQPPTYYGNRHIICSSIDKTENQLDNSVANYFTEENNNFNESEQIQLLNKDLETNEFCAGRHGNMTSKAINDLNIDKLNINGFNKKGCSLILNGGEDLLDSSELISANNLTTPFSVKDILNLVDQTAESYSKMTNFNASFETNGEEDGIKSIDALVDETSPKCYAEPYAYSNQYHYTPTYDHADYYNSFHNPQHPNFPFYGTQEHTSVYFANQYENSSAYHPAILPDYCPSYSSTPNLHYAPSVCQYNSPYANGYQSEIYNVPAPFNESPTKHETSAVSSTASADLSFLNDDVQGSSRSSCAVNGIASASSFSHRLDTPVPHHEAANIGGLTSQHVRQLNSLCAPYEKKQKDTKHRDSESCDSMQSEYIYS